MKKKILALGSLLMLAGCCSLRKPIVVERKVYLYLTDVQHKQPHLWMPATYRDSLLWRASREAMKSATEATKYTNPLYR